MYDVVVSAVSSRSRDPDGRWEPEDPRRQKPASSDELHVEGLSDKASVTPLRRLRVKGYSLMNFSAGLLSGPEVMRPGCCMRTSVSASRDTSPSITKGCEMSLPAVSWKVSRCRQAQPVCLICAGVWAR